MADKNKILLGSALAGLMLAGPGLSISTGNFFQTADLKVGYRLAQADSHETKAEEKTEEKKEEKAEDKQEEKKEDKKEEKKDAKASGENKCGKGACG